MRSGAMLAVACTSLLAGSAQAATRSPQSVPALVSGLYPGALSSPLTGSFTATITIRRAPSRSDFASGTLTLRGKTSCSAALTAENRFASVWFVFVNARSGPCAVNSAPGAAQTLTVVDGRHLKADLGLMSGTLTLAHRLSLPTRASPSQAGKPHFPWCKERTSITLSKRSGPPSSRITLTFSQTGDRWDGFYMYQGTKSVTYYGGGYPGSTWRIIHGSRGQHVTFTLVRAYIRNLVLTKTCISASTTFTITG